MENVTKKRICRECREEGRKSVLKIIDRTVHEGAIRETYDEDGNYRKIAGGYTKIKYKCTNGHSSERAFWNTNNPDLEKTKMNLREKALAEVTKNQEKISQDTRVIFVEMFYTQPEYVDGLKVVHQDIMFLRHYRDETHLNSFSVQIACPQCGAKKKIVEKITSLLSLGEAIKEYEKQHTCETP